MLCVLALVLSGIDRDLFKGLDIYQVLITVDRSLYFTPKIIAFTIHFELVCNHVEENGKVRSRQTAPLVRAVHHHFFFFFFFSPSSGTPQPRQQRPNYTIPHRSSSSRNTHPSYQRPPLRTHRTDTSVSTARR